MAGRKTILVIGTYDTKADELTYLASRIEALGGSVLAMDVSVLGDAPVPVEISKHAVAAAAGSTIEAVIASGDEATAMQIMADGAAGIVAQLHRNGAFDGMIAIGGTMGTDLALDCAKALPMGVPKYIVSTVSFSPLIAADRLAPDIQMILWAGGLYGINAICKSSLSQAAGAVLGASQAVEPPRADRPVIGMTSLGSSCLKYMKALKPELESRGFEVAIFHATGMGGMAFEGLARGGHFAAVMDFALPEISNLIGGSVAHAGQNRLTGAGSAGTPQLVAPGAINMIDFAGWQDVPERYADRPFHAHNRLIKSAVLGPQERRETAREVARRLAGAAGPVHFVLPAGGIEEWDRPGGATHDPEGLAAFLDEARKVVRPPVRMSEIDAHINDRAFVDTALAVLDSWLADGTVARGA